MSVLKQEIDVRLITRWLGTAGAKAGLRASRHITVEILSEVAQSIGIDLGRRATKKELIDEIVRVASKRIDKSIDELTEMSRDELICYFDELEVETEELIDLLKDLELSPARGGRKNVVNFVAQELSETGRFRRIARNRDAIHGIHSGPFAGKKVPLTSE